MLLLPVIGEYATMRGLMITGNTAPSRKEMANALRVLAMDAVQEANSGHPGMPMGMADIAEVLWNDFLKHNPGNPEWPDRDRARRVRPKRTGAR